MRLKHLLFAFTLFLSSSLILAQNVRLDWAKQFSGSNFETTFDIKIDNNGNIYTVGVFEGTVDFDPGMGVNSLTNTGLTEDGFVKKLDPNGNLLWVRHLKGGRIGVRDLEIQYGIQLVIMGEFRDSIDINLQTSGLPLINNGSQEVFTLILDTNGNFMSAAKVDGSSFAYGMDIAWHDLYPTRWDVAYFNDTIFNRGTPIVAGTTSTYIDNLGAYTVLRGSSSVNATDANLSSWGSLYTVGIFDDKIYLPPFGPSSDTLTSSNSFDGFIYKQGSSGTPWWIKGIHGNGITIPHSVLQHPKTYGFGQPHSILIAGTYTETVDFDPDTANTYNLSSVNLNSDIFLQKLDTNGNFIWAKSFGGKQVDQAPYIDTDDHGNIYMAGGFQDTADFDPSPATANLIANSGSSEIFLVKLDSSGNFIWAAHFGGSLFSHYVYGIKTVNNSIYLTGTFQDSIDFDPTLATNLFTSQSRSNDAFVIKLTDLLVGVDEVEQTSQLKLYPNPSPGQVKIDNSAGNWKRLEILDLQGRLLMTKENLNKDILDLELSNMPNGTYLIRFEGQSMSTVQKFVLKK